MKSRLVLACFALACHRQPPAPQVPETWRYSLTAAPVVAAHAVVISEQALASRAGREVLAAGGNAVDAAVATALALAVVYPEAGNLGGGGFAVLVDASGAAYALDFRETAPAAATRDMYVAQPRDSRDGPRAAAVPGSVAGLWELHRRFGRRPWADVVAPAVKLAEEGFLVDAHLEAAVAEEAKKIKGFPAAAALYLPGGQPIAAGTKLTNPDLAALLRRVAADGPAGFYQGATAEQIVAATGGQISGADLAAYRPRWRQPLELEYRGRRVITMPLPSAGGFTLMMIARILEGYDLRGAGWHSPLHLHLLAEAERRAFADRNAYLGDPDFAPPPAVLWDPTYAARRRATISMERATPTAALGPGLIAQPEGQQTTQLAAVDSDGAAVSLTTTLNDLFGGAVLVAGAGFFLNDEMDDFTSRPGVANVYGLVQAEANAIAPGKRPLSSMAPTLVVDDGKVVIATGARGGSRIVSATFQVLSNIVDFGMDVEAAVAAPRVHQQDLPDLLYLELDGFPDAVVRRLEAMGHHVAIMNKIADAPTLLRAPAAWRAGVDPRQGGGADGF